MQAPPPLAFDPFAPALTAYAPAASLIGQTNAAGQRWTQAGPSDANQPTVVAANLNVAGLATATGNSIQFGGNGTSARFNLGTNVASGTLYASFVFKLTDLTGLSASGVFWAGFNNSSGSQSTTPTVVGARLVTRSAPGGYNVGLDKSSGLTGNFAFATNLFSLNQVLFVVGSYQFNSAATNNDVAQLWINPDPSTFGLAAPPPASLTNAAGTDLGGIPSFVFFNRSSAEPAAIIADELRIGASWASVTPPGGLTVAPTLYVLPLTASVVLSWTTNAAGFVLETTPDLSSSNSWSPVLLPVSILGGQYAVTNSSTSGASYFRLHKF